MPAQPPLAGHRGVAIASRWQIRSTASTKADRNKPDRIDFTASSKGNG